MGRRTHAHQTSISVFSFSSLFPPTISWIGPLSLARHRSEQSWLVCFLSVWQPPTCFICGVRNNLERSLNKSQSRVCLIFRNTLWSPAQPSVLSVHCFQGRAKVWHKMRYSVLVFSSPRCALCSLVWFFFFAPCRWEERHVESGVPCETSKPRCLVIYPSFH